MQTGQRVGVYEILEPLGAGGMGEVWRARDSRLGRDVAIKCLSSDIVASRERLARFEREAHILAALNHPRVAVLHGIEEQGDERFLVMELVEGETLERRIRNGLSLDQALALALQIAEALEAAHAKGIVHRDLKPSNVMVGERGDVKLLDFGLSKLVWHRGQEDPTVVHEGSATTTGAIMGTLPYMSPEQISGKPVDLGTDIWSFGCLLFEMLSGSRACAAASSHAALVQILEGEPDWEKLPANTPRSVRTLLRRCLRKDVHHRLQSIGDARIELQDVIAAEETPPAADRPFQRWRTMLPWSVAAALAIALMGLWLSARPGTSASPRRLLRATILLPPGLIITSFERSYPLAISPDGRRIAFVAVEGEQIRLNVHDLERGTSRPVDGTAGATFPFFSPDGEWIGFWAGGWLQKVGIGGGRPIRIASVPVLDYGAAWRADGTVVFAANGDLHRVAPDGSVTPVFLGEGLMYPSIAPDGRRIIVTKTGSERVIQLADLESGERRDLFASSSEKILQALALPTGHLVWGSAGGISAVELDLGAMRVSGSPRRVADDIYEGVNSSAVFFSIAANGTLVAVPGGTEHALFLFEPTGAAIPIDRRRAAFRHPSVSPDGNRIAVAIDADPDPSDVWIFDRRRSTWERFTDGGHNLGPTWTPDGNGIVYTAFSENAQPMLRMVGARHADPLLSPQSQNPNIQGLESWAPDGRSFVMREIHAGAGSDLLLVDRADGTAKPLVATPSDELQASVSPNGRWFAYSSNETGRYEIYVRSFPEGGSKVVISTRGGMEPRWSADGRQLYYRSGGQLFAVDVSAGDTFTAGEPRVLFDGLGKLRERLYDVIPGENRFVAVKHDPRSEGDRLELNLDWAASLATRR